MEETLCPIVFPAVHSAEPSGLVAVTDGLSRSLLVSAYVQGIFPWTDNPVGWFAPPERGVLLPEEAHFPRNFARLLRRANFEISLDAAFADVVAGCRSAHKDQGEWLTGRFVAAYVDLWEAGFAHSVEVWQDGALVGGLYGVQVGSMFCAESMFTGVSHAAKAALHALLHMRHTLGVSALDVQVVNETTLALGAKTIARPDYMALLQTCLQDFAKTQGRRWPLQRRPYTVAAKTP